MQKQTGHQREKQQDAQREGEEGRASEQRRDETGELVFYLASVHRQCSQWDRHQSEINGQKSILMFPSSKTLLCWRLHSLPWVWETEMKEAGERKRWLRLMWTRRGAGWHHLGAACLTFPWRDCIWIWDVCVCVWMCVPDGSAVKSDTLYEQHKCHRPRLNWHFAKRGSC